MTRIIAVSICLALMLPISAAQERLYRGGECNEAAYTKAVEIEPLRPIVREQEQEQTETDMHCVPDCLLTAYCNCEECCGEWAGGPTYTGTMPEEGRTVAVDPDVIPLGSRVLIAGRWYIAEDTGSWVKGDHIDVYMESHDACNEFGRQWTDVYWEENGE
jgi:3D (Asp-Asp-Asp) domain-containing protein